MIETIASYVFVGFVFFALLAMTVEGVLQMLDKDRRRREAKNEKE